MPGLIISENFSRGKQNAIRGRISWTLIHYPSAFLALVAWHGSEEPPAGCGCIKSACLYYCAMCGRGALNGVVSCPCTSILALYMRMHVRGSSAFVVPRFFANHPPPTTHSPIRLSLQVADFCTYPSPGGFEWAASFVEKENVWCTHCVELFGFVRRILWLEPLRPTDEHQALVATEKKSTRKNSE